MLSSWFSLKVYSAFWLLQLVLLVLGSPLPKHEVEDVVTNPVLHLRKRQTPTVVVTGINTFGTQPRLEIRQLEAETDQWNIFLLGLRRFQQTDQSDQISYYKIAGIHGRPYQPWNGVPPADGNDSPGYCNHLLNLFLTWHRTYLVLFEQTLYMHIVDAVNEFPAGSERQRYARAALSWRFPYWDWAAAPPSGQSVYPESVQSPTIDVTMPNGTTTIPNPLYSYQFHPVETSDFYFNPFANWTETKRYPSSWDSEAVSQNQLIGPILDNNRQSLADRLYNLFTSSDNYTQFSNEAWMSPGLANADSLESVHDAIHAIVGSNGHMTYLDFSAYDITFFLHHANVDRLFALWQVLYPDSYVEPMTAVEKSYTIKVGDVKDEDSSLEPFFSDTGRDYWTAASARSIETFGYTYPELANGPNASDVRAAINALYGSSAGSAGLFKRSALNAEDVPYEVVNGRYRQYVANIISQKFALNGSYAVYLFMGDFDDSPSAWSTSPNLVGTHAVFGALSGATAVGHAQPKVRRSESRVQVTGTVPLTSMLLAKTESGELADMQPETVEDYLIENLNWRVGKSDGTPVPAEDVADLMVTVVAATVLPAASENEFPQWSDFHEVTRITHGRPGGC